jgi:hypothetical protein
VTTFPETASGSEKDGIRVPRSNIVEGVLTTVISLRVNGMGVVTALGMRPARRGFRVETQLV